MISRNERRKNPRPLQNFRLIPSDSTIALFGILFTAAYTGHTCARDVRKEAFLARLSSHHRLLYDLVKQRGEINSGELWEAYLAESARFDRPAIALRTFSEYMNRLIELDLVRWDRALVRGKVRVFRID